MSGFKDSADTRRMASENARKAMKERFAARVAVNDPADAERKAARLAIVEARKVRQAEREAKAAAEKIRQAELAVQAEAARQQELIEEEKRKLAQAEQDALLKAEQKAARDARYAARKARR
jgi:membrane protein involved in colicin uptake